MQENALYEFYIILTITTSEPFISTMKSLMRQKPVRQNPLVEMAIIFVNAWNSWWFPKFLINQILWRQNLFISNGHHPALERFLWVTTKKWAWPVQPFLTFVGYKPNKQYSWTVLPQIIIGEHGGTRENFVAM